MTDRDAMRECGTEMRKYFYYASFGQFSLVNDRNGKNALALDAGYFDAARIPFSSVVAGVKHRDHFVSGFVCRCDREMRMTDTKFLTAEEVSTRYRGEVTVGTLRNWRAMRIGPAYVKIGKAVLYPVDELDAWDKKNLVTCRAPTGLGVR